MYINFFTEVYQSEAAVLCIPWINHGSHPSFRASLTLPGKGQRNFSFHKLVIWLSGQFFCSRLAVKCLTRTTPTLILICKCGFDLYWINHCESGQHQLCHQYTETNNIIVFECIVMVTNKHVAVKFTVPNCSSAVNKGLTWLRVMEWCYS